MRENGTFRLSVVIPTYNEDGMVEKTCRVINGLLAENGIDHELLFVDDGSSDNSWEKIEHLAAEYPNVRGIHFSRNFGKESAIYAGLAYSVSADCCVVIDCDLQHPPEKIVEMVELWKNGYEIVEGVKISRGEESGFHALGAKIFYDLMSRSVGIDMRRASDFKLLDQKAVLTLVNMKEKNSFFRALSSWIGYKTGTVTFEVQEREAGQSKWSIKSLVRYAINNVSSFTAIPMQIVTILGVVVLILSMVLGLISLIQKALGIAVAGFTTVIILQLFSSSIIMVSLGIIGYYIAKIYEEVKNRPKYIVSSFCGTNEEEK